MKKLFSLIAIALVASSSIIPAQAELSADGMVAVEYFNKLEADMKKVADILAGVKDKETADAQAPVFAAAMKTLQDQLNAGEALQHQLKSVPSEDDQKAFEQCRLQLQEVGIAIQQELMRLAMVNFYDSEAFLNVLQIVKPAAE